MAETFAAIGTWVAAIAIIVTAIYARATIEQTRFFERVKLTVGVLEAPYALAAVATAERIFNALHFDPDAARQYVVKNASDPDVRAVSGTYCYIAGLYARGVLDAETIFSKDAATIAIGFYALYPIVKAWTESGFMNANVFQLARDAHDRVVRSPQFLERFPALRDFRF